MTSYMTIMVRVVSNKAMAAMAAVRAQTAGLNADVGKSNRMAPMGGRHISSLMKFGNQLQWTGRMLQYNFTLPLLAAAAASTKFYLDQEKAMIHVAKVYGDTQTAAAQFRKEQGLGKKAAMDLAEAYKTDELEALDDAFSAISVRYAVQKKEILEVAGAWAAAGQSGKELARSVDATMKAVVIGDMSSAEATKALISIQAQYNLSSGELMATLANLNSVENQTAVSMKDLIVGFEKSAGVARSAGIETQQLAAYMAALVPATGSASSAGNALKTIISRLVSPTKEAKQVMNEMGLEVTAMSWQNATAAERLQIMAKEFNNMGQGAKNAASSVIASRWQVNRFETLMRELVNTTGHYARGLQASEDQGASFKRMQEELNTVLTSDPKALERTWIILQNAMVKVIIPLIPYIIYLADTVSELADKFANLDPDAQKFFLWGAIALAAIGPIVRYMGALTTLGGVLGKVYLGGAIALKLFAQALYAITFLPIMKSMTMFLGMLGLMTIKTDSEGKKTKSLWNGLKAFYAAWNAKVAAIFAVGSLKRLKTSAAADLAHATTTSKTLGGINGITKRFFLIQKAIWFGGATANLTIWSRMYLSMISAQKSGQGIMLALHNTWLLMQNKSTLKFGLLTVMVSMWGAIFSVSKKAYASLSAIDALYNFVSVSQTMANNAARRASAIKYAKDRIAAETQGGVGAVAALQGSLTTMLGLERSAQAARVFMVDGGAVARLTTERAEQLQRVMIVNSAGVARASYAAKEETARTLALSSGARVRGALEAATQTERVWATDAGGVTRTAAEAAEASARTAYASAGAAARATSEAINEGERVFIVGRFGATRVAFEQAAELQRVIAVNAGGTARVTTEAAAASARLAIMSGTYGTLLAIDSAEGANRSTIANLSAASRVAAEKEAAFGRLFIVESNGSMMTAAEAATNEIRLAGVLAFASAQRGYEAAAAAEMLAIQLAFRTESVALWTAYHTYLLQMQAGQNAAMNGLVAGASASRLAIEQGANAVEAAAAATHATQVYAIESSAASGRMGLARAASGAMVAIEASAGATRSSVATATGTALVVAEARTAGTLVALDSTTAAKRVGIFSRMKGVLIGLSSKLGKLMFNPFVLAALAALGVMYYFRDDLKKVWENILGFFQGSDNAIRGFFDSMVDGVLKAFYSLPEGVQAAMQAVINVVREAALAVYDWFSYINPFARHSPSLVENVEKGMDRVVGGFSKLSNIKKYTTAAYAEIKKFGKMTANLGVSSQAAEVKEDRNTLKSAGAGQALGSYNKLTAILNKLNPMLQILEGRMAAQQAVVDRWSAAVDKANRALDVQQGKLASLQNVLDKYQGKLDEANDNLNYFASAPLKGMRAMERQIFRNEVAQTRLRLEMMNFEDTFGTYDQLKGKIDAINGAQEVLRGTQESLRAAGAGSEILGKYDDEMAKLDQQKDKYAEAVDKLAEMQVALNKLQREAERLDLVKAMKFDELQYQIDMAANKMKELSFEDIMAGIKKSNGQIEKYTPLVNKASEAVKAQQKIVDGLTQARDRLQERLDKEESTLGRIKDRYDAVNEAISAIGSSLSDVMSKADATNKALESTKGGAKGKKGAGSEGYVSPGLQNFRDAGNADFPDPGGIGMPQRKDWGNSAKDIEKWTEQYSEKTANMFEDINPFTSLKEKAAKYWDWTKQKFSEGIDWTKGVFSSMFDGVTFDGGGGADMFGKIKEGAIDSWNFLTGVAKDIGAVVGVAWDLLGPDIKKMGRGIWEGLKALWTEVGPELVKFKDLIRPLGKAISNIWKIAKPFLALIVGGFLALAKVVTSVVAEVLGPLLKSIVGVIKGMVKILRGIFEIIIGFFTMDFKMMFDGVLSIVTGVWDIIANIFKGAVDLVVNIVVGFVKGVIKFIAWMADVLVGHSIIPDMIDAIVFWFEKLGALAVWVYQNVVKPVVKFFVKLFKVLIAGVKLWWAGIKKAWSALKTAAAWMWDNVLKPIWRGFVVVWDEFIKPSLSAWWAGIKAVWAALKTAAAWMWDNVLKPIVDGFVVLWKDYIKPSLSGWWANIKKGWAVLKLAASWMWENVLQPIWNRFKRAWDRIKRGLDKWWGWMKKAWADIKKAGTWFWENVLQPVWDKVKELWEKVRGNLAAYWERVKNTWAKLKTLGTWFWENVAKPVWGKVKDLWAKIKESLAGWRSRIETVWNSLTRLGAWFNKEVMTPIKNAITGAWEDIKTWLTNNKGLLTSPMESIANTVISAVNTVIGGLNKVGKILPGVSWHIQPIEKFAQGGDIPTRRVGGGFKTNGARAIVGEGKANHPEFVIPTDPTYRNRARGLLEMAAKKLGVSGGADQSGLKNSQSVDSHGIPQFGIGGWIGNKWDDVKGIGNKLKKLGKNAVSGVMDKVLDKAEGMAKSKPKWEPAQIPALYGIKKLRSWVNQTDSLVGKGIKKWGVPKGGNVSVPDVTNPGGKMNWKGGTFTNRFVAAMQKAEQLAGQSINVIQGGFRPATKNSGTSHERDAIDLQASSALITALRRVGVAAGDRTGLGDWGPHAHAVPGPGAGSAGGSAVWQFQDYMARGGMSQSIGSPWGLAKGGIVKARQGGMFANIGEGRYDEAVVPLPRDWRSDLISGKKSEGDKTYNFSGDLSFPNITSPDDAKTFLENLDALAKD